MSSDEQSDKECPLCMEPFEEVNFYPCTCQYQICTFCWHRLRTDDNGLCPACRQPYPEQPVNYQPLSSAEIQKLKNEKKQKHAQKNKLAGEIGSCGNRKADRQHLSAFRVLQRNLVYVVGLSQRLADAELLRKNEYFGKFGKIVKVAVGTAQGSNANTFFTAYVTYAKMDDALRAIQAVNNLVVDGRLVKASLGTTKYCSNFLKGQQCHKQECMYLHEVAEEDLSFTKDDMHQGKHTEYERKLHNQLTLRVQNHTSSAILSTTDATESSSALSESTSPENTELLSRLVNRQLNEECKNNLVLSDTEIFTNGRDSSTFKINCNNDKKVRSRNASANSNRSNGKSSVSDVGSTEETIAIIDNYQNESMRRNFNDGEWQTELNKPPPGFSKIIAEKPVLFEFQIIQQNETSCSSSDFPLTKHINGWFDQGQLHMKNSSIDDLIQQPEPFELQSSTFCMPSLVPSPNIKPEAIKSSLGVVNSLFHKSYGEVGGSESNDEDRKKKLISSDSKSVMTCDELERILLNNSIPPGFKRQNSLNNCSGATTKSSRQTPVPPSGINFFLDLYDDLGFDPFSESSKALADMLEEEKTTSTLR